MFQFKRKSAPNNIPLVSPENIIRSGYYLKLYLSNKSIN